MRKLNKNELISAKKKKITEQKMEQIEPKSDLFVMTV